MDILRLNINQTEPPTASEAEVRFHVALLASLASISVSLAARFLLDAPLVPEMMAQLIFAVAPVWIVEAAVGLLGPFAKHLGFLACVVFYTIGLIAATVAFLRYVKPVKLVSPRSHFFCGACRRLFSFRCSAAVCLEATCARAFSRPRWRCLPPTQFTVWLCCSPKGSTLQRPAAPLRATSSAGGV